MFCWTVRTVHRVRSRCSARQQAMYERIRLANPHPGMASPATLAFPQLDSRRHGLGPNSHIDASEVTLGNLIDEPLCHSVLASGFQQIAASVPAETTDDNEAVASMMMEQYLGRPDSPASSQATSSQSEKRKKAVKRRKKLSTPSLARRNSLAKKDWVKYKG